MALASVVDPPPDPCLADLAEPPSVADPPPDPCGVMTGPAKKAKPSLLALTPKTGVSDPPQNTCGATASLLGLTTKAGVSHPSQNTCGAPGNDDTASLLPPTPKTGQFGSGVSAGK